MFLVIGLPRSRTTWLSRLLTYGDWKCGHEELRHVRSLSDVDAWFSQPNIGTVETAAAPWWRLFPNAKLVVVRRPVGEVVESLMRFGMFDLGKLTAEMTRLDHKLDQIVRRLGALEVQFDDLAQEETCARVFEHCLGLPHDHAHWEVLSSQNIQCDLPAMMRYFQAHRPALEKVAAQARQTLLSDLVSRKPAEPEGITIQPESFDAWIEGAQYLFAEHLVTVGEAPGDWQTKNIPLMRRIYDIGAMQIMTARCNGRMFGYLMTLIAPSLTSERVTSATNTTFYASPEFPGLGMKLQRAALCALKERGINEVVWEAGHRGSGPRLGTLYRRLGAQPHGQVYRLELAA